MSSWFKELSLSLGKRATEYVVNKIKEFESLQADYAVQVRIEKTRIAAITAGGSTPGYIPVFYVPANHKFYINKISIISYGAPAGINSSTNKSTVRFYKDITGVTQITDPKIFDGSGGESNFPNCGATRSTINITTPELNAGEPLSVGVVNGGTAATPDFIVQVEGYLSRVPAT